MSLSTCNQWLSVASMAGVERQGHGSLGNGGPALGISHSLSCGPHTIQGTYPLPFIRLLVHQGQSPGCGSALSGREGSCGTCSSSVSRLLQPIVCGDEGLRVFETGDRSFRAESEGFQDIFHNGDSPVSSSLSPERRLDGVSGLEGCVLASSDSSGQSQVPQVHGVRSSLPIQGSVLWSLHGTSGLYQGHGSGFRHASSCEHSYPQISRQLADSGCVLSPGSPGSGHSSSFMSLVRNHHQLGEVSPGACAKGDISGRTSGLGEFQGFACPEVRREASLNRRRISILQPASSWLELLGVLSSLIALVPGGRLRMRALQLALRRSWDRLDHAVLVSWDTDCHSDLEWWLNRSHLEEGVSLSQVSPNLDFWSDASDVSWGSHLGDSVVSDLWSPQEIDLSINVRELLAVDNGLHYFTSQLVDSTVAIFVDNSTAVAYLRNQEGTKSPLLNSVAQRILRWAELVPLVLAPQFIKGKNNVLADALSRPNQVQGSEWTLKQEVFPKLQRRWPVMLDLFATSLNHQCSLYFSPYHDPKALGTNAFLQTWDGYQVFAFPPWSLIPRVLKKL